MTRTRAVAIPLLLLAAASLAAAAEPDFATIFAGREGCFELYDLATGQVTVRFNPKQCELRTSPMSTFKVPLALMAFDAGVLKDESSAIKWDGTHYARETWNRDQTAATWMQYSVVWFSQKLTPQLGMARIKDDLAKLDYGNHDASGGLTRFWLESSLKISPDEQLRFWVKFWREELPVSSHAFAMTKKITLVETSPGGWVLHGKTGSGSSGKVAADGKTPLWIGWFAGHVERDGKQYVFVTRYVDVQGSSDDRPAGLIASEMSKQILGKLGLY